eukprot:scaffold33338_cov48-Phaeocystis_antarctica.AAC.2
MGSLSMSVKRSAGGFLCARGRCRTLHGKYQLCSALLMGARLSILTSTTNHIPRQSKSAGQKRPATLFLFCALKPSSVRLNWAPPGPHPTGLQLRVPSGRRAAHDP